MLWKFSVGSAYINVINAAAPTIVPYDDDDGDDEDEDDDRV